MRQVTLFRESEMKHTPGPWKIGPTLTTLSGANLCDIIGGGKTVADCVFEEDARLIAAAPELLHELYAAAAQIEALGGDARTQRAAIAKATGETK